MKDDSAFWHRQAERFDSLKGATNPIRASFDPDGRCAGDRWGLSQDTPSPNFNRVVDELKSVAAVCSVALDFLNTEDAWAEWLEHPLRESVDFESGFTRTGYDHTSDENRPHTDAELLSTTYGEIEDVCAASARVCRRLADECERSELALCDNFGNQAPRRATVIVSEQPAPESQATSRATWLRAQLQRKGLNMMKLSQLVGADRSNLYDWRNGKTKMLTPQIRAALAQALGIQENQLPE
jgi:hypothetical protein